MKETLLYFVRRALRNMRQWPLLCSASILTMAITLTIVAGFFLLVVNLEQLTRSWSDDIQLVVYLQQPLNTAAVGPLKSQLEQLEGVVAVRYLSPAAAMERFKQQLADDDALLDGVRDDLLPASFELQLGDEQRNQKAIAALLPQLESVLAVDEFSYGQEWLGHFNSALRLLRLGAVAIGLFLLLTALFIVSNTIKLTFYARQDELEIMALVGATMRFIKTPFLLEGALQGLIGGVAALVLLAAAYAFIASGAENGFGFLPIAVSFHFLSLAQQGLLVLSGVLLGVLGSLTSLRRFVRI